jgi:Major Facilitator Superfamily.
MLVNPLQSTDVTPITSALGDEKDLIQLAAVIGAVGMVTCMPIVRHFQSYFQRKKTWLFCLFIQLIIAVFMIHPVSVTEVIILSFLSGTLKAICLIDAIRLLMVRLNPTGSRGLFYGIYYTLSNSVSQFSVYLASVMLVNYEWYYIYYYWFPGVIISILIVGFLMHKEKDKKILSLKEIDWLAYCLWVITAVAVAYCCVMGERLDWFSDGSIEISFLIFAASGILFLLRTWNSPKPLINLKIIKGYKQIGWGACFMFLLYFVYNSTSVLSSFLMQNFKDDSIQVASSGLWLIPAFVVSIPLTGIWLHKKHRAKESLIAGFLFYAAYYFITSKIFSESVSQKDLIISQLLRGVSYGVCITSLSYYMSMNVNLKDNAGRVFYSVNTRYIFASSTTMAFFRRWLLINQAKYYEAINARLSDISTGFSGVLANVKSGFINKGFDAETAHAMATKVLMNKAHQESVSLAATEIFTILAIVSLCLALLVMFLNVFNIHYVRIKNQYSLAKFV